MSDRVQDGGTYDITAFFADFDGSGVTGLSATVRISREGITPAEFWQDPAGGYSTSPDDIAMTEIGSGFYHFAFDTSVGVGANEEAHAWEAIPNDATIKTVRVLGSVVVGGFIDNLDAPVSAIDTATMRGTDGVDTAPMRGTDGANTTVPLSAAADTAAHAVTQAQVNQVQEAIVGRTDIDITTDPWRENHYDLATRTSIVRSFDLFDQDGVAIAGDDTAGNNPLFDSTRLIADRRLV